MLLQSFKFLSVDIKLISDYYSLYFAQCQLPVIKNIFVVEKVLSLNAGQFCACQVKSFQTGICIYIYSFLCLVELTLAVK